MGWVSLPLGKDRPILGFGGPPSPQSGTHLANSSFAFSEVTLANYRALLTSENFPIFLFLKEQENRHIHMMAKKTHLATWEQSKPLFHR